MPQTQALSGVGGEQPAQTPQKFHCLMLSSGIYFAILCERGNLKNE